MADPLGDGAAIAAPAIAAFRPAADDAGVQPVSERRPVLAANPPPLDLAVDDEHDVSRVVRQVQHYCSDELGLSATFAAHVATAASELANNLWLHADRGGRIRVRQLQAQGRTGVEICAEDDGPGIADVDRARTEGYSTAGGLGCGLSGVQRLMDDLRIVSTPGLGTRVLACKWLPSRG